MTKDFLIVPSQTFKLSEVNYIIDKLMDNKKIKLSSKNYIIIGNNKKIIFDISKYSIKGRLLNNAAEKEIDIINKLILNLGSERVYIHYYNEDVFLDVKNAIIM